MHERKNIARAAGSMSAATMISRVLGFVRDMILALFFGATALSDTFFVAFRIPNLLRELFAEGAMSSAVIPVLTDRHREDPGSAFMLVRVLLGFVIVIVGIVCIAGIVIAPQIVTLIAPGFLSDPEKFATTVVLTRIMFPFLLFISLASVLMASLNTRRVFFVPALAPAFLNIAIIVSVLLLSYLGVIPVIAAAIGVAIGGLLQCLIQMPAFHRLGYSPLPVIDFSHPGLRQIITLVIPMTFGIAISQINIVVSNILASFLPDGSITYLFYSMRLVQFPIGVFGVAVGMAVLPSLSSHMARGDMDSLRGDFSFSLRLLFFVCVPSMAGLIALRTPIVSTLFQRGLFDYAATQGTADSLLFYSFGVWAVVGVRVITSAFYSMKDTKTPVKSASVALLTNILLGMLLMGPLQHRGLALAYSISAVVNFFLLFAFLRRKLGGIGVRVIAVSFAKTAVASAVMAAVGFTASRAELWQHSGNDLMRALILFLAIGISAGVYIIISRLAGSEELDFLLSLLRRKTSGGTIS